MSNMSYCRFENTLSDLRDCLDALYDGALDKPNMSESERASALELIEVSGEIYNNFSYEDKNDDDGMECEDD